MVRALIRNHGSTPIVIERDDSVVQMLILKVERMTITEAYVPSDTKRGSGAFGSTSQKKVKKDHGKLTQILDRI